MEDNEQKNTQPSSSNRPDARRGRRHHSQESRPDPKPVSPESAADNAADDDNVATQEEMAAFIEERRKNRKQNTPTPEVAPLESETGLMENWADPYLDPDPAMPYMEYRESPFLSHGCDHCPTSYVPVGSCECHRCSKLDATNWMKGIMQPQQNSFDCVEVRFKNNRKDFYRLPDGIAVTEGDVVAVEGMPGHDVGIVSLTGEACRLQMKKKRVDPTSENIRKLFRRARPLDIEKWAEAVSEENAALFKTRRIAEEMNLVMKINDVEMQGDRCKAIFYYTADERVDFRGLIKVLAEEFHVRVEMKQIGVRQEASKVGGLGTCGRELCCCTWLTNFQSVTTSVAKAQQILPNPQKLAGQCGKLKCCLNFEYDVYIDDLKDFPPAGTPIRFQKGLALYKKTDVFRGIMWYAYENEGDLYAIPAESVKKIIEMNRNREYPERLEDFQVELMSTSALAQESSEAEFDQELKRMADSGKEVVAEEARPERGRGQRPERGERSEGGDRRRGLRGEGGNRQSRQEGGERRHGPRQGDRQERPRRQNDGAPRRERSSNSQTNGNETPRHE